MVVAAPYPKKRATWGRLAAPNPLLTVSAGSGASLCSTDGLYLTALAQRQFPKVYVWVQAVQARISSKMPPPFEGPTSGREPLPISVTIDPVALITTECITVTSAMRKHARWAHSSVASILGGGTATLGPMPQPNKGEAKGPGSSTAADDISLANRWGLRGKRGKSMQDNPLMAGFGRLRRDLTGCKGMCCSSEQV